MNAKASEQKATPSLWTPRQAAMAIGVSDRTLWTMQRRGELPVVKVGRLNKFDPKDIEDFINRNRKTVAVAS